MKFDELDFRMRVFEMAHDHCVLPGIHIVARIDGRSFTRLTKDVHVRDSSESIRGTGRLSITTPLDGVMAG